MAKLKWPLVGVIAAIAITTTMDATGLSMYSALPLFPLAAILWAMQRLPRADMGLRLGRWRHYGLALLHAILVIGVLTALVLAFGKANTDAIEWNGVAKNISIGSAAGTLAVFLTEEGFFRGWLWAALRRAGLNETAVLMWSSLAFTAWHVSAVMLDTGFNPPPAQLPTFFLNAFLLGIIWGRLRAISGSILVASVCHSSWNAVAYTLYGFGTKAGALGIKDTLVFAPETGIAGLVLNALFAALLFSRSFAPREHARDRVVIPSREDGEGPSA
jgi:uncharacterized protein